MKKLLFLCNAMLLFPAAGFAAGVDLTWNECVGTGMEANNQTFTCSGTVNQSYDLVVQFKSPVSLNAAAAVTAIIDLQTDQGAMPLSPFWRYDLGGCQRPSVGVEGVAMFDDIRLLPGCAGQDRDLWDGDGSGGSEGIGAYGADFPSDGRGRFVLLDARELGTALEGGMNYYAFHLTFNNRHRADCAGCEQKAVLVINRLTIESTDGAPALDITGPDKKSYCATINGAGAASTEVALEADPNPAQSGDLVELTATVAGASGTVHFYDGGNPIGSVELSGGTASLAHQFFDPGDHSLRAYYKGDDCYTGSTSAKTTLAVEAAMITITDTTVTEGDAGLTNMVFRVRLSSPMSQEVTVGYTTMDFTATTADNDYQAQSGTLSFPPGTNQQLVTVKVVGDNRREANEQLRVVLSNPSGPGTIADDLGVGSIVNEDTPTISIDNVSLEEGNTGKTVFNFTVTLSKGISEKVSVNYQTQDGNATVADNDYQPTSGTLSFAPKARTLTIPVSVNGDSINEPPEVFRVVLSSPVNGTLGTGIGTGRIVNDDGDTIDIGIVAACVTDTFGFCVDGYRPDYPVSIRFTVINKGNRAANEWSFDITLSDTSKSQPIAVKTQIAGPPIPAGGSVTLDWATGYEFDDTQMGIWQAEVVVRVKTPDHSDPTPANDRAKVWFAVDDIGTGTLLALFEIEPVEDGLELRWRFVDPHEVASVSLERGESASGPWVEVGAEVREEGDATVAVDRSVSAGQTYWYRLTAQSRTGEPLTFGPLKATAGKRMVFALGRIIPNPSLGATRIEYTVARETAVRLSIVDVQGREVAVLRGGVERPGVHQVTWSGRNEGGSVPAGLYFARYQAAGTEYVRRIVMAR